MAKLYDLHREGELRPDRARHAALAQRAGLPRRARPPDALLRGARAAGLPAARPAWPRASSGAGRASCSRCSSASRASTCSRTSRSSSARWAASSTASSERAKRVNELLADPAPTFLLVTSPEREPIDEAIFFWRKLKAARMPFGGVIVNRVHHDDSGEVDSGALAADLAGELGDKLAARVAENFRDYQVLATRDRANIERLAGKLDDDRMILVPSLDDSVHDIEGLSTSTSTSSRPRPSAKRLFAARSPSRWPASAVACGAGTAAAASRRSRPPTADRRRRRRGRRRDGRRARRAAARADGGRRLRSAGAPRHRPARPRPRAPARARSRAPRARPAPHAARAGRRSPPGAAPGGRSPGPPARAGRAGPAGGR